VDVSPAKKEMTRSLNEYAETLQNELVENDELRRQIEILLQLFTVPQVIDSQISIAGAISYNGTEVKPIN